MKCDVRIAQDGDAEAVSRVILSALRETNANDYSQEIIERVAGNFTVPAVRELMRKRVVFVAVSEQRIIGTASLDGRAVRTVFVAPGFQGRGVGKRLIAEVERAARDASVTVLVVHSSVTAERFYSKLGFKAVGDSYYGDEHTIVMERHLTPS